jgi:hypothetical protein
MKIARLVVFTAMIAAGLLAASAQNPAAASTSTAIGMDDPRMVLLGQIDIANPRRPRLGAFPGLVAGVASKLRFGKGGSHSGSGSWRANASIVEKG